MIICTAIVEVGELELKEGLSIKIRSPLFPLPLSSLCVTARGLMPMLTDKKRGLESMDVGLPKMYENFQKAITTGSRNNVYFTRNIL
jgi:hypothetical protein